MSQADSLRHIADLWDGMDADLSVARQSLYEVVEQRNTFAAEVKLLKWSMRQIEWCGRAPLVPDRDCPGCFKTKEQGHLDDCMVLQAVKP